MSVSSLTTVFGDLWKGVNSHSALLFQQHRIRCDCGQILFMANCAQVRIWSRRPKQATFVTFGIPEELTSDGGPQFTAGKTQEFLKLWGVHHRLTSVANLHGNCRAEVAVKTVKRMLMDNTGPTGSLDVDQFQRAMLVYRNTIEPETRPPPPALILFGRPIRDPIPIPMGRYCPDSTWKEMLAH